jgi:hypothetical protein
MPDTAADSPMPARRPRVPPVPPRQHPERRRRADEDHRQRLQPAEPSLLQAPQRQPVQAPERGAAEHGRDDPDFSWRAPAGRGARVSKERFSVAIVALV